MRKLNKEQIEEIPNLLGQMSVGQIAQHFDVHITTISRWIRILRTRGTKIIIKMGPRTIL